MTSRWLTCFSLGLAAALAADVTGNVELADSRDPGVRKKKDYSGVVIWLEPSAGAAPRPAPRTARMVQKDKSFRPHVVAIPVGSTVDFPNYDPIFHNAFSNYNGQVFDVGLYPPGSSRSVKFTRSGIVRVFCNIHAAMSAVIVVVNTPWVAVSSASGAFQIPGVPPGEYTLNVFHERATQQVLDGLQRTVTVDGDTALPVLRLSEGGYLTAPHSNKYGKPYPPAPDAGGVYPAASKK